MTYAWDRGSLMRLQYMYPEVRELANMLADRILTETSMSIRITEGHRSYAYQDALYSQGRTTSGKIVTWARGGQSFHNFGVAFDICFRGNDPYLSKMLEKQVLWDRVGNWGVDLGLKWGGNFPDGKIDRPHFEKTYGMSERDMDMDCRQKGLAFLWGKIDVSRGMVWGDGWKDSKLPDLMIKGD